MSIRLGVLISGRGSNLAALIGASSWSLGEVVAVVSDRPDALGLSHARQAAIPHFVVDRTAFSDRDAFEKALEAVLFSQGDLNLIVLAGFMRILSEKWVLRHLGRLINIHPALLPAFRGLNTHARALQAGVQAHGASVHFVTPELDAGPVILQAVVPVLPDDTPLTLSERVLSQEHIIYPQVVRWFAQGRVSLSRDASQVVFDGRPLLSPVRVYAE